MAHAYFPSCTAVRVTAAISSHRVRKTLNSGVLSRSTVPRLASVTGDCENELQGRGESEFECAGVNSPRGSVAPWLISSPACTLPADRAS